MVALNLLLVTSSSSLWICYFNDIAYCNKLLRVNGQWSRV